MVRSYSDHQDIVMFQEEVSPFHLLCMSIHYHTVRGPEPANNLLVKEPGYFLRCALFQWSCPCPCAAVFPGDNM